MQIKTEKFREMLKEISSGLERRKIILGFAQIHFMEDRMFAFNDKLGVSVMYDFGFRASVSGPEFKKFVSKVESEDLEMTVSENETYFKVKAGNIEAGWVFSADKIPGIDLFQKAPTDWKECSEEFLEALKLCSFSVSQDPMNLESSEVSDVVSIEDDTIISSDGFRVSQYKLSEGIGISTLIPGSSLKEIFNKDIKFWAYQSPWLYFKLENGGLLCCKTINKKFRKFRIDPFNVEGVELPVSSEWINSIDITSVLLEREIDPDKLIEIILNSDEMICLTERDIGYIKSTITLDGEVIGERRFYASPIFLTQVLALPNLRSMILGEDRILFDAGNFKHVVLING